MAGIGNDRTLDMALLGCSGRPGDSLGVVGLSEASVARNADIYTLHQNCDYYSDPSCAPFKKYSGGRITQTGNELGHNADTLGGSSGAPVFSSSHVVIGLHHAGSATSGNGRGSINWAVPMSRIVPVLRQRYPSLQLGARAPVGQPSGPSQGDVDEDEGDGYEPNNTLGGATPVAKGFTSSGARIDSGDVDVFAVEHGGGALTITTTFTHAQGDLDLYVLNQNGAEVGRSIGTTGTERVAGSFAAGRLHIRVVGYQNATGAYTLTVR